MNTEILKKDNLFKNFFTNSTKYNKTIKILSFKKMNANRKVNILRFYKIKNQSEQNSMIKYFSIICNIAFMVYST